MGEKQGTEFVLKYSNHVVEHLGVKLYQNRPTNALAELVANAWDAEAEKVWIDLYLDGPSTDWWISVGDDGTGMSATDVQRDYLIIGRKRRDLEAETTPEKKRPLMGRKGIGKLAPFGIARTVDVFTLKKANVTWLGFNLDEMLEQGRDPSEPTEYRPDVNFVGSWASFTRDPLLAPVDLFLKRLQDKRSYSGTLIILRGLAFSSKAWSRVLSLHLANRLVPALTEVDFSVLVNGDSIILDKVLPSYAHRIPLQGWDTGVLPGGREIRYWALVVDLERYHATFGEDWTQERAGVAVYAHKKIAQDRPFFFGLRGRELYSRYLYGVVDADWVDELSEDVISTDRTSLNWDHPDLSELRDQGQKLVREWLNEAQKYLRKKHSGEVEKMMEEKLRRVPERYRDSFSRAEVQEMAETILSLAPHTSIQKVVDITLSAVAHMPSWELLKDLVRNIQAGELSEGVFGQIVFDLRFFENANLALVIARRLQAMLALDKLIARSAREVGPGEGDETASVSSMHQLFRNNPWLLDLRWAAVADELPPQLTGQALKAAEAKLEQAYGDTIREFESWRRVGQKAMDFVLLHIMEFENVVIVVEIKRADKTLTKNELRQLQDYMDGVRKTLQEHSRPDCTIRGVLIGGKWDPELRFHLETSPNPNIRIMTWKDLLSEAKQSHQEFLRALAVGLHDDPRLKTYLEDLGQTVSNAD